MILLREFYCGRDEQDINEWLEILRSKYYEVKILDSKIEIYAATSNSRSYPKYHFMVSVEGEK